MIYVNGKIVDFASNQSKIEVGELSKSALDRSSRSVLDSYIQKFKLSNLNLEQLKVFMQNLSDTTNHLRDVMENQRITLKDQCGDDTPATDGGRTILDDLEEALDKAEDDLSDLEEEIKEKQDCLQACYGGGQGGEACITTCEINCQGTCEINCQQDCQSFCQSICESHVQQCMETCEKECQSSVEQKCTAACETYCQADCEKTNQNICNEVCESVAQNTCETLGDCSFYGQACKDNCEVNCLDNCETICQSNCEQNCQGVCLVTTYDEGCHFIIYQF